MMQEQLYHLYYSGISGYDLIPNWKTDNSHLFCTHCHRLKLPRGGLDLITDEKIRKNLDMTMIGYLLIPGCMSTRLLDLLGKEAENHLNLGNVYLKKGTKLIKQPFVTFISKYKYIPLRGETPYYIDGKPIEKRLKVCPECLFCARVERSPWFLLNDEYPKHPIQCTDMGLLLYESVYEKLKNTKLVGVCVEKVKIKQNTQKG
ncbi:hypothetical protein [Gilliamella sp. GillExp13]|uniref:hypothetical protein n=1 Tax=Gilliamella sp. GillExp13 TaxID=3120243 RepID=UPI001C3FF733|nr:hypothetical protein [Gilliamella apicola]